MPHLPQDLLRCPLCRQPLELATNEASLGCTGGHRFDAAKQGYFNLLTGKGTQFQPDTADMVQARGDFLGAGHYGPLRVAVAAAVQRHVAAPRVLLDAGAGTGYYLAGLASSHPAAVPVALDISKFALRRAAKILDDGVCLVWDVWRTLPVRTAAADVILNIFAPRHAEEFHRVLVPGGILVVVTPLPGHLSEIAETAGLLEVRPDKAGGVAASVVEWFTEVEATRVEYTLELTPTDVHNVALMGPAGHHLVPADLVAAVSSLSDRTVVSARFTVQVFRKRAVPLPLADV